MNLRIPTSPLNLEGLAGSDFQTAAAAVLAFMRDRIGFGLWMVTRVDGDDWIVLAAEDHGYGVTAGNLFRWSDSFCSRMVIGSGPRVAPNVYRTGFLGQLPNGNHAATSTGEVSAARTADGVRWP
jgi:hypothetical protein